MLKNSRLPAAIALVAALLGLTFAAYSTFDYMQHLDRQLHDVHCSFIPGLAGTGDSESPCRTAMYSPYGSLFRESWWGGIPVALFALGAYVFFAGYAAALVLAGPQASRRSHEFFGVASLAPLLASVVMAFISAIKLGVFCKTCVGMYAASVLLAVGGLAGMVRARRIARDAALQELAAAGVAGASPSTKVPPTALVAVWLAMLGVCVALPALAYVSTLPDYSGKLLTCGKIEHAQDDTLLVLATQHGKRPAVMVSDPLCPTCKALHSRLTQEGALENLLPRLVLMPLDNECNWMLDRPLHPGSCVLAKAVLCAEPGSRQALEWIYEHQEELTNLGKSGSALLRARVRAQFGPSVDACIDTKKTDQRLNNHLQFAVKNQLPVSTPQLYLGETRICDEDTDLGLRFTLAKLAPEVLR